MMHANSDPLCRREAEELMPKMLTTLQRARYLIASHCGGCSLNPACPIKGSSVEITSNIKAVTVEKLM
jgi:hypothetical protein